MAETALLWEFLAIFEDLSRWDRLIILGVTQMTTFVGPADGPVFWRASGRSVDIYFATNVAAFDVWIYMNGHGGSCIASLATRTDR